MTLKRKIAHITCCLALALAVFKLIVANLTNPHMYRTVLFLVVVLYFSVTHAATEEHRLWFYLSTNLLVDENVDRGIELLNRAAKAGYNGVLLADSKFSRWGEDFGNASQ